ncbi:MAG TPA: hemerythrin domain-containing protein [Noviherbaspirillum sp.]|uniref:hemerythrin domain-containing protein n=1 Tax=Noviherbaspirillum sp. TaxID=1926288 RepID=UPI002B482DB9|nr:hemerythrin domain-containing protein [Noviherbaspirillum sp.]HJV85061.1 hemerythrin domain-containing protein [Noviherbaspirillum sp.]
MTTISRFLGSDHKRCDDLFANTETSVSNGQWDQAATSLNEFVDAVERHFGMEEQVLFPTFEKAIGSTEGPTRVMRMEHEQMRSMMAMLKDALAKRDADDFFGHSDTFNTMVQQHNMKEETILYQMSDRVLSGQQEQLISEMSGIGVTP